MFNICSFRNLGCFDNCKPALVGVGLIFGDCKVKCGIQVPMKAGDSRNRAWLIRNNVFGCWKQNLGVGCAVTG